MTRNSITADHESESATADQPMSTGMQPAAPPQTMFCAVRRLRTIVYPTAYMRIAPRDRAAESQLTNTANQTVDATVRTAPKTSPSRGVTSPVTIGRLLV